ncbi:MAG: hypothetical protein SGARI_001550 [Bacillariaceae sp.]
MDHMASSDQLGGGDSHQPPQSNNNERVGSAGSSMAFDSFDKIQVDFDNSDLAMDGMLDNMGGNDDLDKLLAKESTQSDGGGSATGGIDLDLSNFGIEEGLLKDGEESVSSMDKLMSMNLIEVEDLKNSSNKSGHGHNADLMQEFAQGFLAQDGIRPDYQTSLSGGADPLLGNLSGHGGQSHGYQNDSEQLRMNQIQQQQQMLMKQQYEMQQQQLMEQEQMMQMQRMMQNNKIAEGGEALTVEKVSKLASMGSADLELEKMKLMARLQEINSRGSGTGLSSMGGGGSNPNLMHPQQVPSSGFANQTMSGAVVGSSAGVASVMGGSNNSGGNAGETPLSAFLRNKNKGSSASGVATTAVTASLLSQKVPNAPAAASILDAAPMDYGGSTNPFLRKNSSGNSLVGAMNKSSSTQDMIRNTMSGRGLRSSGVALNSSSGSNLMEMLGSDLGKNAAWGGASSGLSSRHRGSKGSFSSSATVSASLAKTKNRVGSLSRENSLYNMMKNKHGSHKALKGLGRPGSSSRLSSTGSRGSMARSDSKDSLVKRSGSRAGSKYRMGASTSVPHLGMNPRNPPSSGQGGGGNALW